MRDPCVYRCQASCACSRARICTSKTHAWSSVESVVKSCPSLAPCPSLPNADSTHHNVHTHALEHRIRTYKYHLSRQSLRSFEIIEELRAGSESPTFAEQAVLYRRRAAPESPGQHRPHDVPETSRQGVAGRGTRSERQEGLKVVGSLPSSRNSCPCGAQQIYDD